MSVIELIRLISLAVSLFISLVGFVITLVKSIKNAIQTKNWNALKVALQEYIAKAEEFTNFTGEEKKEIVMAWATNFCATIGMKFDTAKVSNEIEDSLKLSKLVNQREKDKIKEAITEENKEGV